MVVSLHCCEALRDFLRFTSGPSCNCEFEFVTSPSTRKRTCENLAGNCRETQELLLKNLLSSPSQWCDSRLYKRSYRHSDLWHKRSREPLWLDNQEKPLWVSAQLPNLNLQLPHGQVKLQGSPCAEWSAGDEGRVETGQSEKTLSPLFRIDQHGTSASMETYKSMLVACTNRKALSQAKRVYAYLTKHGLESTSYLGESVVNMLVKCGDLEDAIEVFSKLQHRTSFSWTALIFGYTEAGRSREALKMYECMRETGVEPSRYTFVSLLKACGSIADLEEGKRIHTEAVKFGCDSNLIVGTCIVKMYAKCGSIMDAQEVFDRLPERDILSWTAMLAAYVQHGKAEEALQVYAQLQEQGVVPSAHTFVPALQACGNLAENEQADLLDGKMLRVKSLQNGKAIHAEAWKTNRTLDVFIHSTLISMYGKCRSIIDAQNVFDQMPQQGLVSWTAMLGAYVQNGQPGEAFEFYRQMSQEGVSPDAQAFVSALQACSSMAEEEESVVIDGESVKAKSLQHGREIHVQLQRKGYESNIFVGSTLVSMYGNCGCIVAAEKVYDGLSKGNVVSWNVMLLAYVHQGQEEKALQLYFQMQQEVVSPDARTFVNVLQACSTLAEKEDFVVVDEHIIRVSCLQKGKAIHADALNRGHELHVFVGNALVTVYGKCGCLMDAHCLFDGLSQRDVVTWNAMLSAYSQQSQGGKALQLYERMVREGVTPDDTTFTSVLHACCNIGALEVCSQVHRHVGLTKAGSSPVVASALIHAYGKCARMESAQDVFDTQVNPDVVSWTALMAGYARQGNCEKTLQCYEQMRLAGVKPNGVTFLCLLSSCSHAGMIDLGVEYLESMTRDHGIALELEHYTSLVDLLGRAGHFTLVLALLSKMPMHPDLSVWMCLLASCRKHGNVVLGRRAFDWAVHIEPTDAVAYVLMSNLYIQAGMWDCAREVNELRETASASKRPGQSWIEHREEVHSFMVRDSKHVLQKEINGLLVKLSANWDCKRQNAHLDYLRSGGTLVCPQLIVSDSTNSQTHQLR